MSIESEWERSRAVQLRAVKQQCPECGKAMTVGHFGLDEKRQGIYIPWCSWCRLREDGVRVEDWQKGLKDVSTKYT